MKQILAVLGAGALLGGCAVLDSLGGDKKPKTALLGDRVAVLAAETGAEVDPALADMPVSVPPSAPNDAWAQPSGNASHSMGHPALGTALTRAWTASIAGGSKQARLGASPVVADGKVYVIDTEATVHAFSLENGGKLWSTRLTNEGGNRGALFGGGVSVEGGKLFATNGVGDAAALDASNGSVLWKKRPGGPLRGAPVLANGHVYVVSQDNQLFAMQQETGDVIWNEAGTLETTGVFGVAAPAAAQGTVVAGFSSGELNAYRYENGRPVWQDALSRTSISTAVASLSDIDADPVIDEGRVYAIGQGGRMVALELVTGQRLWELNIAGIATPWVSGEWLFVVTDDARLLCIAKATGRVRWIAQLPRWRDPEDKKGPISWVGPVLAGDRLILASTEGTLQNVAVADGSLGSRIDIGGQINLAPVVAANTLLILDNRGRITALR